MSSPTLSVRPIRAEERARYDETLVRPHWLGTGLVGEVMRYFAEEDGEWCALLGFGSAALCVKSREELVSRPAHRAAPRRTPTPHGLLTPGALHPVALPRAPDRPSVHGLNPAGRPAASPGHRATGRPARRPVAPRSNHAGCRSRTGARPHAEHRRPLGRDNRGGLEPLRRRTAPEGSSRNVTNSRPG